MFLIERFGKCSPVSGRGIDPPYDDGGIVVADHFDRLVRVDVRRPRIFASMVTSPSCTLPIGMSVGSAVSPRCPTWMSCCSGVGVDVLSTVAFSEKRRHVLALSETTTAMTQRDHDRCEDQCAAHYAVLHENRKCGRQKCDECSDPGDADSRQQTSSATSNSTPTTISATINHKACFYQILSRTGNSFQGTVFWKPAKNRSK